MTPLEEKEFYWGASIAAHQVEGGNRNDWTDWEARTAELRVKKASGKVWPEFILKNYPSPLDEETYVSGKAADHYHRFRGDFDLARGIGLNAFRFSIEWSRIEPEEGQFDKKEIEHYREVLRALRERGIEPFVTLWHWTLPIWVVRHGGWKSRKTIFHFSRFCRKVAEEFRHDIRFWIVLNEPGLWTSEAYLFGFKPPAKRNIIATGRAYFHLVRAHKEAYRALKSVNTSFSVGISESGEWIEPRIIPRPVRYLFHYLRNYFFLKRIEGFFDFIGLNYYRRSALMGPGGGAFSDMGWEVDPEGIYYRLRGFWQRFHLPLFVTENGIADARDELRPKFIQDHIEEVMRARNDGIDVRGYFHWSLLDNFEWEEGFWPRFGLFEVDYRTMERKKRESADVYADIIRNSKP